MRNIKTYFLLIILGFFCSSGIAYAEWQIDTSKWQNWLYSTAGQWTPDLGSPLRGHFATKSECEEARRRMAEEAGDSMLYAYSKCVGYDSPSQGGTTPLQNQGSSGTGNFSQDIFAGLMQSFMQGFMQGMAAPPSRPSPQQQAMLRKQQEQRWAEYRARVRKQVKELEDEYRRLTEEEFNRKKGRLLSDLKARYSSTIGREETSLAIRQLNCSAYWGVKAAKVYLDENVSLDKREELSRMYAQYSSNARSFSDAPLDECPPIEVEIPPPGIPQPANFQRDFYNYIEQEAKSLVPVIRRLEKERDTADETIRAKKQEIKRIEMRLESTDESKEDEEDKKLLEEAYRMLNQAIEEKKKAEEGLSEVRKKTVALEGLRGLYDKPIEAKKEKE